MTQSELTVRDKAKINHWKCAEAACIAHPPKYSHTVIERVPRKLQALDFQKLLKEFMLDELWLNISQPVWFV